MKAIMDGKIPEWLLIEVLIRLPVNLVFRYKLVCKKWLSMTSNPSFVRMYISRASKSPQLQPWTFVSNIIPHRNPKDKLLANIYKSDFKYPSVYQLSCPYALVGGSNGLVLCAKQRSYRDYTIWNPVTGQCIALPRFPRPDYSDLVHLNSSFGFLTHVQNGVLTSYGVVLICWPNYYSSDVTLKVFLSEIGQWKEFTVCVDRKFDVNYWRMPTALNGILHWMTREHGIIAYDPYCNPDCFRFIASPGDETDLTCNYRKYSIVDAHKGRLRYFEYSTDEPHVFFRFGIWLLNDYSTGDWCLQHRINSSEILYDSTVSRVRRFLQPLSFHPFDSDIVYLVFRNIIVSYNIRLGKLEVLSNEDDPSNNFPYSPSFLFVMPPWPTSIPPQSFGVVKNW